MYSLGGRLSSGASEVRLRYSWSRRCIRNGTHASPLSTQITFNPGKRSGRPLISQLVMCTMLQCTNEIACIEMKRFIVFIQSSSHVGPAWNAERKQRSAEDARNVDAHRVHRAPAQLHMPGDVDRAEVLARELLMWDAAVHRLELEPATSRGGHIFRHAHDLEIVLRVEP